METQPLDTELTDGVIMLCRPRVGDAALLVAGRDDEFRRFIGVGSQEPEPSAVILDATRQVIGWIDYDAERAWLGVGEVNVGYSTFPEHRGQGFAQRSLLLLLSALAQNDEISTATLLIDPANAPSIAVASATGFQRHGNVDGQILYKRSVRYGFGSLTTCTRVQPPPAMQPGRIDRPHRCTDRSALTTNV